VVSKHRYDFLCQIAASNLAFQSVERNCAISQTAKGGEQGCELYAPSPHEAVDSKCGGSSNPRPATSVTTRDRGPCGVIDNVQGRLHVSPVAFVWRCIINLSNMVPKTFQPGYPNTTGFRKVVKATIYVKKKEGMSDEDFIEYYNTKHAQSAVPILQRHGIISYSLVNLPSFCRLAALGNSMSSGKK
jgi:hypothetical protein